MRNKQSQREKELGSKLVSIDQSNFIITINQEICFHYWDNIGETSAISLDEAATHGIFV